MKHFLIIFLVVLAIVAENVAVNYCAEGLCPANVLHIGCENPALLSWECPPNAQVLNSYDYKEHILEMHNWYRNYAASGVHQLSPACQMQTMVWDDELELLAQLNVQTCKSEHDQCHNTVAYPNAGQNVGVQISDNNIEPIVNIGHIIQEWFEEGAKATKPLIGNFYQSIYMPPFTNFATMVMDKNNRIGCAVAGVPIDDTMVYYVLTCNYAHAPVNYTTIYSSCETAGQNCEVHGKEPLQYLCV